MTVYNSVDVKPSKDKKCYTKDSSRSTVRKVSSGGMEKEPYTQEVSFDQCFSIRRKRRRMKAKTMLNCLESGSGGGAARPPSEPSSNADCIICRSNCNEIHGCQQQQQKQQEGERSHQQRPVYLEKKNAHKDERKDKAESPTDHVSCENSRSNCGAHPKSFFFDWGGAKSNRKSRKGGLTKADSRFGFSTLVLILAFLWTTTTTVNEPKWSFGNLLMGQGALMAEAAVTRSVDSGGEFIQ